MSDADDTRPPLREDLARKWPYLLIALACLVLDQWSKWLVEVHLSDLDDFDAMDAAYREFFNGSRYPARTTTESPRLFGGSKVEISCQARR